MHSSGVHREVLADHFHIRRILLMVVVITYVWHSYECVSLTGTAMENSDFAMAILMESYKSVMRHLTPRRSERCQRKFGLQPIVGHNIPMLELWR